MRKISLLLLLAFISGCVGLTSVQRKEITTRVVGYSYKAAYRGALKYFLDSGYMLKNTDMDTGLIISYSSSPLSTKVKAGEAALAVLNLFADDDSKMVYVHSSSYLLNCVVSRISYKSARIVVRIQKTDKMSDGTTSTYEIYNKNIFSDIFFGIRRNAEKYYKDMQKKVMDALLKNKPQPAK